MTLQEWLAVAAVLTTLLAGLPLLRKLCLRFGASAEVSRKSVHVAMGLACACFPWIFHRPLPVWILAGLATIPILALRLVPTLRAGIGSTLHGVKRPSYGEVLFAPAVALVFHLSGSDPLLHLIPVLTLTVADAAGAIAGTHWGHRLYVCGTGKKSIEGSIAFLVVAFLCAFLPLWVSQRFDPVHSIAISLILSILVMMAEGISDRGFDNLVIPIGCHFLLTRLLLDDTASLVIRSIAATLLLVLVVTGARWSTLTGSALIGAALLGYGCAVLAGWPFLLPPLAVFLCHLFTTRRHRLVGVFDHRLDAVISHAIACLPWVVARERGWLHPDAALAGISFAMAIQLAQLDSATQTHVHGNVRLLRSVGKGWIIAALPGLIWLWPRTHDLLVPSFIAVAMTFVVCLVMRDSDDRDETTPMPLWISKGIVSLLAATPALLLR